MTTEQRYHEANGTFSCSRKSEPYKNDGTWGGGGVAVKRSVSMQFDSRRSFLLLS